MGGSSDGPVECFVGALVKPSEYGWNAVECFVGEGPSLDQITFEMFHISKVSFCRKCDLRQNPRHVVARCTTVQR